MFNKANVVGILIKAKKHGLVFFDGEIVFAVSSWLWFDSSAVRTFDVCWLCAVQWLLFCSVSSIRLIRLIRFIRLIRLMILMFVDYVLFSDSSSVQSVRSEDDDEFVVLQKPIGEIRRAFGEMRDRWEPIFKDFESILNFEFRSSLNFESILNFDISTSQALRHVWIRSKTSSNNLLARGLIQVDTKQ